MNFSEKLWQQNQDIYQKILNHPFNQQLADGTLPIEIFKRYLAQDSHYLVAYAKALAIASTKAPNIEGMLECLKQAEIAVVFERSLHQQFIQQDNKITTACHHYCSFITATAWAENYPIILATLLPCFLTYEALGQAFKIADQHPYKAWIETYTDPEFLKAVHSMERALNQTITDVSTQEKMQQNFRWAIQLELKFWDSAYKNAR